VVNTPSSPEQPLTRRQLKQRPGDRIAAPPAVAALEERPVPSAPVTPKPSLGKRILSWGTMIATPLLFIGVSLPVNIFYGQAEMTPAIAGALGEDEVVTAQSFTVAGSQSAQVGIQRQSWSVTSFAEVLKARYGSRSFSYSTTGTGSIRWPFPTAVPISSGFGDRVAPCRYCSSDHRGVDFVPGNGAPIFAIADGVVTASEFGGGYGQYVYLEHDINGRSVLTVYAHMQRGSSPLRVGDVVEVGDFIGLVGNTGISTGPHLHFEVRIEGEYVDPFAWLKENAF
jgi:murein DD-endopeptidase MepM/ murein hydrolase activator NlpD